MNAVEIEEAVSELALQPYDPNEFPFAFLSAFGNNSATINRLRSDSAGTNKSDLDGVLQRNKIHIKTCPIGQTTQTLRALKDSPATTRAKAKFILATDGEQFEAQELESGEIVADNYGNLADRFGFFLPLAGITTVRQIRENSFDIRATSRLNRLYIELLKNNSDWGTTERRHDMNHFMARLIFCFFAEDTEIFQGDRLFTTTIEQMSDRDSSNTHTVMSEIFRAMNTKPQERSSAALPRWVGNFPYVNGGLFSGSVDVPQFSRTARSYLLHIGSLDWTKINPDIFGSMIQAIAEDEERGQIGMHYTSVPNILKVLNPLFLDELRERLEEAGENRIKLLNLRKRLSKIRVFDPACGSGNFLVIAYKELRDIEATINKRRGEEKHPTQIPLTNFRGIELRDFPAEIARLALIIAEFQCNALYLGKTLALAQFLPLDEQNWIVCGNALRLDWLSICPPSGAGVLLNSDDLFSTPLEQVEMDFENEGGETYICGNPPYLGSTWQSAEQKADLGEIFAKRKINWKSLDYVAGWFMKAADYGANVHSAAAFVTTNSICQGQQVPILWSEIFKTASRIVFAHTSFKWANLASYNAGVTVAIVGISTKATTVKHLYSFDENEKTVLQKVDNINAYLIPAKNVIVEKRSKPISALALMDFGNKPVDGGNLLLSSDDLDRLNLTQDLKTLLVQRIYGSAEFIRSLVRYCLWITDEYLDVALENNNIKKRIDKVAEIRTQSTKKGTQLTSHRPHQFGEIRQGTGNTIIVPSVSSESRLFLPVGLLPPNTIVSNLAFALYDAPIWNLALIASRLHLVWIATVCGRLKTDFRYSNTLGWNTFPVPTLTEQNLADLTRCAEDILLAREHFYPATIAEMYEPERMKTEFLPLLEAHQRNDEIIERIYIGRRFRNDTERLEKLFDLYTKMTAQTKPQKPAKPRKPRKST
jgi:hypothetical protein